jgi:hypothetical protein
MKTPYKYIFLATAGIVAFSVYSFLNRQKNNTTNTPLSNTDNTIIAVNGLINQLLPNTNTNNEIVILGTHTWNNPPKAPLPINDK